MLEGSGPGAARDVRCVAETAVAGRAPRQTAQRSQDATAFARLLVKIAVAGKPPASLDKRGEGRGARDEGIAASPLAPPPPLGAWDDGRGNCGLAPRPSSSSLFRVELLDVEAFAQTAVVLRSGGAACLLRIASPDLGVVRVLVMQTRDGVNIRFVAEQDLTRQILDRQLDQLRTALANAGIDLGEIEVVGADEPETRDEGRGTRDEERKERSCLAPRPSPLAPGWLDVIV